MAPDNKDTKLAIRISEEDLKEIDEFLNTNPRFGSRSEFIRHSVLDYISRTRIGIVDPGETGIRLSKNMDAIISTLVQRGFFKTKDEVIEVLLEDSVKSGDLHKIIEAKMLSYNSLLEDLDKFEDLQERLKDHSRKKESLKQL
ncbi:MAG: ribbon-helix-helix domain-containing protein [Candidatus Thermoplasmatota archaeon]|nr:ribbon-helix-helix domain-containing protein [Candidatus Thermoplasmatota archaeon]MDA8143283.1 ribbon-helix-helix domain-containing protein [Thermoplasmatales archaeon]